MNEKKKLYIIIGIIVALATIIVGIVVASTISNQKMLKEIDDKINSEETQIFYLARPTCHYCVLLEPITDQLKQDYHLEYNHINVDDLTTSQLTQILKKFGTSTSTFGTPYIVITKNGKVVGEQNGYSDENILFELFQKNGLIGDSEKLPLNYINYETFQTKWNSEDKSVIMIGQTGQASIAARKHIQSIVKENHLDVSYMDISATGNNETYSELLKTIGQTNMDKPILIIVQNGKILLETNESTEEAYRQFLKSAGYLS